MTETYPLPEACRDMGDVRAGVDATDRELMALLDRRFGYMRAAARIKTSRDAVRDEGAAAASRLSQMGGVHGRAPVMGPFVTSFMLSSKEGLKRGRGVILEFELVS